MDIFRISAAHELAGLLASRAPVIRIRLEEGSLGRAAFDGPFPEGPFVRVADEAGYSASVTGRGGRPPSYAWMGPGDRWVDILLTAGQPTGRRTTSAADPVPRPLAAPSGELLDRYRAWVGNGEYAACFSDWVRRSRAGIRPSDTNRETLFWLNALAAYAGMRDGRADSTDIATAAGLAEQALDHSDADQVDFARQIRAMYGL